MRQFKAGLEKMLADQIQKMQRLQQELGEERVQASAGGGMVEATASGLGDLIEVKIKPEAVDPNDVEMLQDLVLAAVREALSKARDIQQQRTAELTGGLDIPGLFGA
ncbi:MAG: YbaB/EbfC family nucleoid-associated protein [Armatimonadota bacterium]|nr:MAG: YbaB/EbfC family nucleoid-associated protein [Armatimonadota bacterium]